MHSATRVFILITLLASTVIAGLTSEQKEILGKRKEEARQRQAQLRAISEEPGAGNTKQREGGQAAQRYHRSKDLEKEAKNFDILMAAMR